MALWAEIVALIAQNLQWKSWDRCDRMQYSTLLRGGPGFAGAGACAHSCWWDRWSWSAGPPSAPFLEESLLLVDVKSKKKRQIYFLNNGRKRKDPTGLGWQEIKLLRDICYWLLLHFWLWNVMRKVSMTVRSKRWLAQTKTQATLVDVKSTNNMTPAPRFSASGLDLLPWQKEKYYIASIRFLFNCCEEVV